jgi:hypothetical protein
VLAAAVSAWFVFAPVRIELLNNDLTLAYIAVQIGLQHGWSHIYSLDLQHQYFAQLRPGIAFTNGEPYFSPPPLAALVLPFSVLGPGGAFFAWTAASLMALGAAWWLGAPGQGWYPRILWLLGALAWYPVLYGLAFGQPVLMAMLAVVACWRLAESGRPYLAGAALAGALLKPQLILVVPAVLLVAGRWRIVAAWVVASAILALASFALVGFQGVADYRALAAGELANIHNRYFTLAYVFGPGPASLVAQGAVGAAALVGAYVNRRATLARLIALGLVAGTLAATYWHLQDFTMLVAAGWLFWRDSPPIWQRLWLAAVVVTLELAWPLRPLPILIAIGVWLVFCLAPPRAKAPNVAGPRPAAA